MHCVESVVGSMNIMRMLSCTYSEYLCKFALSYTRWHSQSHTNAYHWDIPWQWSYCQCCKLWTHRRCTIERAPRRCASSHVCLHKCLFIVHNRRTHYVDAVPWSGRQKRSDLSGLWWLVTAAIRVSWNSMMSGSAPPSSWCQWRRASSSCWRKPAWRPPSSRQARTGNRSISITTSP